MNNFIKSLFSKKVIGSLFVLFIVILFTYALYTSEAAVSITGNIIKTLSGK